MKERGLIIFDIVMTVIIVVAMFLTSKTTNNKLSVKESKQLANNSEYSFDFVADPEHSKVKAGDTVTVMLSLENLRMGEHGLNNVIGYLTYDESVYDELNIEGVGNWNFQRNEDKNHEMFGKFVIYTMQEGVTEHQNIVKITAKLKADLQPQTTKINFTNLKSSDGELSVDGEDKTVEIEICEESVEPKPEPKPEAVTPDEPVKPEPQKIEEQVEETVSIKTGDAIALAILALVIATIALNIVLIYKNKETNGSRKGLKLGIITATAIIIAGLIVLGITVFAHNTEITAQINSLDKSESWLKSQKYLVTDESISRIAPLTNINEIEDKFNKDIFVYQKGTDNRVTSGLVKTGMRISDRDNSYNVSVLGDINEDGESNQIELTDIIRASVNPSTWNYSGVKKLSADMNVSGSINAEDVNTSIRYILYGELVIPGFNQVVAPKIEVVGGTYNETIEAYEDTIRVKITEQDENATKTEYKVEGTTSTSGWKELEEDEIITLTEDGVYKISAYTYGALGNKSEIPYIIVVKKDENNNYKVITKTEKVDGTYEEVIEEKRGRIGSTVTIGETVPEGFSINQNESTLTGEVTSKDEEELTLVVTYDRNEYTLTLQAGDNIDGVAFGNSTSEVQNTVSRSIKYGRSAEITAKLNSQDGYTITFNRWRSSNSSLITDNTNRNTTIEMPIGDVTLTAIADKVAIGDIMYKVEYYYQQNGTYSSQPDDFRSKNGQVNTEVTVDDLDKTPTRAGYVLDTSKQDDFTGTIAGDGSTALKVYFKQQFTVTYKPGDKGTFAEQKTENLDYNADTPAFVGEKTHVVGYSFTGWDKTVENKVTETVEYIATWTANTDTEYKVQYYLENLDSEDSSNPNNYTLIDEKPATGTTDTHVIAAIIPYTGFTLDSNNENNKLDGDIAGDGSLVLKVYYTRNSYELALAKYENVDTVEGHSVEHNTGINTDSQTGKATFKYEQPIQINATLKDVSGYTVTFSKWESSNTELLGDRSTQSATFTMPAGDITLTATTNQTIKQYAYKIKYFKVNEQFDEVQKEAVNYGTVITTYDEEQVTGYELDQERTGDINLTIGEDENLNVINVYYKPIVYSITYDLAEGSLPQGGSNPSEYTIATEDFALVSPTKQGYVFNGWTGGVVNDQGQIDNEAETGTSENVTEPTVNLNVQKGSIGNRKYTANWEEGGFSYTVEYYYEGDTDYIIDENKTETGSAKYNSTVSTYIDKAITGYELRETPTPITISYNVEENVMKVYYKKKEHRVLLQKDNNIEEVTGAGTYKFGDTVSINATLKTEDGYTITWNKWEGITEDVEDENDQTASITVPDKDVIYKATATKVADTYTIQYMLNGGEATNETSYTIESNDIELSIPTKQGYVFQGWTGGTEKENPGTSGNITTPTRNVTIRQGSMGDRLYTAHWVGDSQTTYTVEHYKENLDGTYTLEDTVSGTGTTDETAVAVKKTYEGFEFDEDNSNNLLEGIIKSDGSLVLKVYYKRIVSTLRLAVGNNITKVEYSVKDDIGAAEGTPNSGESTVHHNSQTDEDELYVEGNFKYGTQINISATVAQATGYTITWDKWESNAVDKIVDQAGQTALIGMPVGNVSLTAKATKTVNSYGYTIEYYYDEVKDDTKTETNTASYGTTITNPREKAITGYEIDRRENVPLTITENEETNLIKMFYKQTIYSIEYDLAGGEMPAPEEGQPAIENPTEYTVTTPNITLHEPVKSGYSFIGWTGSNGTEPQTQVIIEQGSTGDKSYTANWRANTDTQYKIEHYLESLDGTYTKDANDDVLYGTTGSTAEAEEHIRTYEGYTHDSANEQAVESGTIAGDGSLVLKVYYKRNIYTLRLVAGDNVESVTYAVENASWIDTAYNTTATGTDVELKAKYGATVSIDAVLVTEEFYNITNGKWTSNNASVAPTTLNADIVIPAGNVGLVASATKTGKPYNYSVEYYYDNNLEHTQTETAEYNSQITTYVSRNKTGYKLDHTEGLPLTISNVVTRNVIKVYYVSEEYTIEYTLNGGELAEGETNPETYTVETETFTLHNPEKQGYVFTGWTGSNGTEAQTEVSIAKGSTGNKNYTANWRPSTEIGYTIEYYTENVNSTEDPESSVVNMENYTKYNATEEQTNKIGTTGQTVTATPIEITGFTYNMTKSAATISGTVVADGSLVLKVFYTRNSYNLKLVVGDENIATVINNSQISSTEVEKSYKYEQTVQINAVPQTITGYTVSFKNWTSSNTSLIANSTVAERAITMPAGDVTLTATGEKQKAKFIYTVEYYYENEDGTMAIDSSKTVTGAPTEYESQILTYEAKEEPGYELDSVDTIPLTITAAPEDNVIKVYYKLKTYNITYDLDGGELEEGTTNPSTYTIKSENFTLNNPEKYRYVFKGWTGGVIDGEGQLDDEAETGTTPATTVPTTSLTIQKGSQGNRKYTANWEEKAYEVTVHHYLQGTGPAYSNSPVQVASDEIFTTRTLGEEYDVKDLIPTYDEHGNIINEDASERNYLDATEIHVVGNSGNTTGVFTVEPIEVIFYYQYYSVVRIVSSPEESLNGTEYVTVEDALNALKNAGLTRNSGESKLELLKNINNQNTVVNNLNVALNLNAHNMTSDSATEPTIKVTNSKLTIMDENESPSGKIINTNGTGVYVDKDSEFTLGIEELPVIQTPEIVAKDYGIEKEIIGEEGSQEQGVFNFFDGKITADQAVKGTIDLTPVIYKATATIDSETGKQISVLSIITDKEARIGRRTYSLLENAIEAASTSGEQVEIVILKNIVKDEKVVVPSNKNIKLDLDGYTITTTSTTDYVMENQGKLEIVDSSATEDNIYGNGKIMGKAYSTILNSSIPDELEETYSYLDFFTPQVDGFDDVDGKMVSNNQNRGNKTADAYKIIDLTDATEDYTLVVNAEVSSELNHDYGYATITNSASVPSASTTTGRFIYISGEQEAKDYSTVLKCGQKHYLHLCYYKDSSINQGDDAFTVNSVRLYSGKKARLTLTSGRVQMDNKVSSVSDMQVIKNDGDLYVGSTNEEYTYEPYIYSPIGTVRLVNGRGNVTVNKGYFGGANNSSITGVYAAGNILINGGTFQITYSVVHTSDAIPGTTMTIKGGSFKSSVINYSKEQFIVDGGTFNSSIIVDNTENPVLTINGGTTYRIEINKSGTTTINNATILNGGIKNYASGSGITNMTIEDATVSGYIETKSGTMTIKNGTFSSSISNSNNATLSIRGGTFTSYITNGSDSVTNIYGGTIKQVNNNGNGTLNIYSGTITENGSASAVKNSGTGTVNIYGGTITGTYTGTYGAVENSSTGTINIGNKNDEIIAASTPIISGVNEYGVVNTKGTVNFYDGTIKGSVEKVIHGCINDMPEGYEINISYEGENNQIEVATLTIPQRDVAQINETKYKTLQSAVDACPNNSQTTIKVIDKIYLSRTVNVSESKDIILDLNANAIRSFVSESAIINNGMLEIKDNTLNIHEVNLADRVNSEPGFNLVDGKLVSTNKTPGTTAHTYIPLDLTEYDGKSVVVSINAKVSSQSNDIGNAKITENTTVPSGSSTSDFIYISGEVPNFDFSTSLVGGKVYYLHLLYRKGRSGTAEGDDEFTVNSVSYYTEVGTMYSSAGTIITNNGTMDLKTINMRKDTANEQAISNNGTLQVNGAKISSKQSNSVCIYNAENANLTVNSGEILGSAVSKAAILNDSTNDLLINGGYIKAGITNQNGGTVKTKNCSIEQAYSSGGTNNPAINNVKGDVLIENGYYFGSGIIVKHEQGNITIQDGIFKDGSSQIYAYGEGTVEIFNGKFINGTSIFNVNGNRNDMRVIIHDGECLNVSRGFEIGNNKGIVDIYGGTFVTSSQTVSNRGGTVSISNATMTSKSSEVISNSSGTVTITSGSYTSLRDDTSTAAIYNFSNATVTIGEDDGSASKVSPSISGIGYGVKNNGGTIYFYDGILEGKEGQAIYGNVIEAQDYNLIKETVTKEINGTQRQRQIAYLDSLDIAQVGGQTFNNLQDAVTYCADNEHKTIELIRDVTIGANTETVNIPANKDITLDLKGFNIAAGNLQTFKNSGEFEIVDTGRISDGTTVYGELRNTAGSLFKNSDNGNLKLTSGIIKITQSSYTVDNQNIDCYLAINEGQGTITVNGANISASYGINNTSSGTIQVSSGYIDCSQRGINNVGESGKVFVDDGTIKGYYSGNAIYTNNGTTTINGGTIGKLYVGNNANLVITGGSISDAGGGSAIYMGGNSNIQISGGTVSGRIYMIGSSNGTITNGTFTGNGNIECYGSSYLTIVNGTFTSTSTNITNKSSSTIFRIKGGTYETTGNTSIENNSGGNVIIEGGTFTAKETINDYAAIENGGTMVIVSAEITGYNGIISYEGHQNKLTLGVDDNNIENNKVKINATNIGVVTRGTCDEFYYYDGTITAEKIITGEVTEVPTGYRIVTAQSDDLLVATLQQCTDIASIQGKGTYKTLQAAINAAGTEETTIKITNPFISSQSELAEISDNQNITIDLNGCTIENHGNMFSSEGTLKFTDSSTGGTGIIKGYSKKLIENTGTLEMNINIDQSRCGTIISNENSGSVKLLGGNITARQNRHQVIKILETTSSGQIDVYDGVYSFTDLGYSQNTYFIYNTGTGNININGGTVSMNTSGSLTAYGIYTDNTDGSNVAKITISDVDMSCSSSGSSYGIYSNKYGNIEITGGNIHNLYYGIRLNGGSLLINGDDVNIEAIYQAIYNNEGTVEIRKGTITSSYSNSRWYDTGTILNISPGTVIINGGTITATNNRCAIYNSGNLTMNGGTVTADVCGLYCNSENNTVLGGEIITSGDATNQYGVYIPGSKSFTLGQKEYPVSETAPAITSNGYGVYKESIQGTFNFYDGIVTGNTKALFGDVNDTPELYGVKISADEKEATLGVNTSFEDVASMDNMSYDSLQVAVLSAGESAKVIELQKDIVIDTPITIAAGQNITMDLNGFSLILPDGDYTIINNGTLTIVDSMLTDPTNPTKTGVENMTGTAIYNNGTLTLGTNDSNLHPVVPTIEGNTYGIENIGIINMYDGVIIGKTAPIGQTTTITDKPTGYTTNIVNDTENGIKKLILVSGT